MGEAVRYGLPMSGCGIEEYLNEKERTSVLSFLPSGRWVLVDFHKNGWEKSGQESGIFGEKKPGIALAVCYNGRAGSAAQ